MRFINKEMYNTRNFAITNICITIVWLMGWVGIIVYMLYINPKTYLGVTISTLGIGLVGLVLISIPDYIILKMKINLKEYHPFILTKYRNELSYEILDIDSWHVTWYGMIEYDTVSKKVCNNKMITKRYKNRFI